MLKAKDLRDHSQEALEENLNNLQKEIFQLRGEKLDVKTQKVHLIGQKRKEIARIKTILRERQLKAAE